MNSNKKIITASMLAALTFVFTIVIKIPSPIGGYLNLGDAVVLLAGAMLSPLYAFLCAGIGSAVADLSSGFFIYAPATFLIKGVMALIASIIISHSAFVKEPSSIKSSMLLSFKSLIELIPE